MSVIDNDEGLMKIQWASTWTMKVGGIPVIFGRTAKTDDDIEPVVIGAALSEKELRSERCGYGTRAAEAAADLFRLMRPSVDVPSFLDF